MTAHRLTRRLTPFLLQGGGRLAAASGQELLHSGGGRAGFSGKLSLECTAQALP